LDAQNTIAGALARPRAANWENGNRDGQCNLVAAASVGFTDLGQTRPTPAST
jgi:hypothetical protein